MVLEFDYFVHLVASKGGLGVDWCPKVVVLLEREVQLSVEAAETVVFAQELAELADIEAAGAAVAVFEAVGTEVVDTGVVGIEAAGTEAVGTEAVELEVADTAVVDTEFVAVAVVDTEAAGTAAADIEAADTEAADMEPGLGRLLLGEVEGWKGPYNCFGSCDALCPARLRTLHHHHLYSSWSCHSSSYC